MLMIVCGVNNDAIITPRTYTTIKPTTPPSVFAADRNWRSTTNVKDMNTPTKLIRMSNMNGMKLRSESEWTTIVVCSVEPTV